MEKRWESVTGVGKKEKCGEEVAKDMCSRRRIKQTLSVMVRVWKRAPRERVFLLLGYDSNTGRTGARYSTEFK